jgi:DNA-binding Lrp family transcriptional regulator
VPASRYQKAFVLIKVDPGSEDDVVSDLLKLEEVKEVHIIPGEWDILAVVEAEKQVVFSSDETIYKVVLSKIEKIKHIRDTNTMVSHFSKVKPL